MKTHEQRVKEIVARHFGVAPGDVGYTSHFVDDFGADEASLRLLLETLQRELCFDILESDTQNLLTPKQVAEFIQEYCGQ
ncbi:hypothetical protein AQ490_15950 [Wenjunlia vitaminophila]|uniref:Acyl carrier protein n=1 Tax=Wenjunlia vitaminophila TaxID=76728 RepID=A0A0T6LXU4_WENVI|nr:hypothetical protein [Wenjunlia vitaminophila]KRV50559.1 hypothetical protein AQ490_15950 [Wenjunlia vitaminophila]